VIYYLYLTLVLTTGEPQYEPVGPVGPNIADCVKFAQYVIPRRVAVGDVKNYTFQCNLRPMPGTS
jgi:hypothetical protein